MELEVVNCNIIERFFGLMFRSKKTKALLFDFKKRNKLGLHSFFVFFPFIALWLDEENNVLELRKVKPWKLFVGPNNSFFKILEIPVNKRYKTIIDKLI